RRYGRRRRGVLVGGLAAAALAAVVAAAALTGSGDGGGRRIALVSADGAATDTVATLRRSDQGITVELAVKGLEAPPTGSFYECWYVGEGDTADQPARLSAGTFTVAGAGTGTTVRMTTAADPSRYPRIEITLEPDDGDPRRTGPVVLRSVPRSSRTSTTSPTGTD
ncbi:MAG: anti-sigma factor, partial [Acidimicrobiales bacterium]